MVRVPGTWKNFDDLEEHISLDELEAMLDTAREIERDNAKFLAGLQGIDLDKNSAKSEEERFNEVRRRAAAKNAGVSEEVIEFAEIGISFNEE
jgi:hypothetical protein